MISSDYTPPFFSILLTLYNAEAFVEEALSSIAAQGFTDVELIISDDASTDGGLAICRQWLEQHPEWASRSRILETPYNTGVTANMNRAVKAARGRWIKDLSADDALLPNALELGYRFVLEHPETRIFQAVAESYKDTFQRGSFAGEMSSPILFREDAADAKRQFQRLLREDEVVAPSLFIRRDLLVEMEYYDERIPSIDDWPLWIKITRKGVRIDFMNEKVVKYRLHNASVSRTGKGAYYTAQHRLIQPVFERYIYPHLPWWRRAALFAVYLGKEAMYRYFNRSDHRLSRWIYQAIGRFRKG